MSAVEYRERLTVMLREAIDRGDTATADAIHLCIQVFDNTGLEERELLTEVLTHDERGYGPWTRGMRERVRNVLRRNPGGTRTRNR